MQDFITAKKDQIAELCRLRQVERLAIFGSAVRDDFDPTRSDVDVLVAFRPTDPFEIVRNMDSLHHDLVTLFDRPVHLIREGVIKNPYRLRSINHDKVSLYAA
jgi:uncharacterized protein